VNQAGPVLQQQQTANGIAEAGTPPDKISVTASSVDVNRNRQQQAKKIMAKSESPV